MVNCEECKEKHIAAALGYVRLYLSGNEDKILDIISLLVLLLHHFAEDYEAKNIRLKRKLIRKNNQHIAKLEDWLRELWKHKPSKSSIRYSQPVKLKFIEADPILLEATKNSIKQYCSGVSETDNGPLVQIPAGLILLKDYDMQNGLPISIPTIGDKICCGLLRQMRYSIACICPTQQALNVLKEWLEKDHK